jgi:hypothetical protein
MQCYKQYNLAVPRGEHDISAGYVTLYLTILNFWNATRKLISNAITYHIGAYHCSISEQSEQQTIVHLLPSPSTPRPTSIKSKKKKLRGMSALANYTDQATIACRRS